MTRPKVGRPREYDEAFAAGVQLPLRAPGRLGIPELLPYRWRAWRYPEPVETPEDRARRLWVLEQVRAARERARELVRAELRACAWWIPRGFTEAQLDAIP